MSPEPLWPMCAAVNYAADKSRIRSELMKLAHMGELTYYGVLGKAVGVSTRWPLWKAVLDEISREETAKTEPDITFLILNANTGWPSQIGFRSTDGKPAQTQKIHAQNELIVYFNVTALESQHQNFRSESSE